MITNGNESDSKKENEMSKKTKSAIAKYGMKTCMDAYLMACDGFGASTIGCELGLTTNQADAAINAGREIPKPSRIKLCGRMIYCGDQGIM